MSYAHQIKSKISKVTKIIHITEDNDPNNLIGRPNGYTDGAILYINGANQDDFGVADGAFIEIWPTKNDASARAKYIQGLVKAAPMIGTEPWMAPPGTWDLVVTDRCQAQARS